MATTGNEGKRKMDSDKVKLTFSLSLENARRVLDFVATLAPEFGHGESLGAATEARDYGQSGMVWPAQTTQELMQAWPQDEQQAAPHGAVMARDLQQTASATLDFDQHGVPWNPDVHSASKSKTQAGAWTLRKGGDKAAAQRYIDYWRGQQQPAPQPQAFQAPAPMAALQSLPVTPNYPPVDYQTWLNSYMRLHQAGRWNEQSVAEMFRASGVTAIDQYTTNDNARAVSYAYMQPLIAA